MKKGFIVLFIALTTMCIQGCMYGVIVHNNCSFPRQGSITLGVAGGNGYYPESAKWYYGGTTFATGWQITGVSADPYPYTAKVKYVKPGTPPLLLFKQQSYFVLNEVSWFNTSNVALSLHGGISIGSSATVGSAKTIETISSNSYGFFEVKVSKLSGAGITTIGYQAPGSNNFIYYLTLDKDMQMYCIMVNTPGGVSVLSGGAFENGDVFRLYVNNNVFNYTKNENSFANGAYNYTGGNVSLNVSTAILGGGLAFPYVRTSFGCFEAELYYTLARKLDGSYYIYDDEKMRIKFDGEYNTGNLSYKVYNWKREIVQYGLFSKKFGDNRVNLNICGPNYIFDEMYTLEVTNEKSEIFMLRFKFRGSLNCINENNNN